MPVSCELCCIRRTACGECCECCDSGEGGLSLASSACAFRGWQRPCWLRVARDSLAEVAAAMGSVASGPLAPVEVQQLPADQRGLLLEQQALSAAAASGGSAAAAAVQQLLGVGEGGGRAALLRFFSGPQWRQALRSHGREGASLRVVALEAEAVRRLEEAQRQEAANDASDGEARAAGCSPHAGERKDEQRERGEDVAAEETDAGEQRRCRASAEALATLRVERLSLAAQETLPCGSDLPNVLVAVVAEEHLPLAEPLESSGSEALAATGRAGTSESYSSGVEQKRDSPPPPLPVLPREALVVLTQVASDETDRQGKGCSRGARRRGRGPDKKREAASGAQSSRPPSLCLPRRCVYTAASLAKGRGRPEGDDEGREEAGAEKGLSSGEASLNESLLLEHLQQRLPLEVHGSHFAAKEKTNKRCEEEEDAVSGGCSTPIPKEAEPQKPPPPSKTERKQNNHRHPHQHHPPAEPSWLEQLQRSVSATVANIFAPKDKDTAAAEGGSSGAGTRQSSRQSSVEGGGGGVVVRRRQRALPKRRQFFSGNFCVAFRAALLRLCRGAAAEKGVSKRRPWKRRRGRTNSRRSIHSRASSAALNHRLLLLPGRSSRALPLRRPFSPVRSQRRSLLHSAGGWVGEGGARLNLWRMQRERPCFTALAPCRVLGGKILLRDKGEGVMVRRCLSGASAGALAAVLGGVGLPLAESMRSMQRLSSELRKGGTLHRIAKVLKKELRLSLPDDAAQRLNARPGSVTVTYTTVRHVLQASEKHRCLLCMDSAARGRVSVSAGVCLQVFPYLEGQFVRRFYSREDLIECLVASCNIPFYLSSWPTVTCRGRQAVDGYFATKHQAFGCPDTGALRDVKASDTPPFRCSPSHVLWHSLFSRLAPLSLRLLWTAPASTSAGPSALSGCGAGVGVAGGSFLSRHSSSRRRAGRMHWSRPSGTRRGYPRLLAGQANAARAPRTCRSPRRPRDRPRKHRLQLRRARSDSGGKRLRCGRLQWHAA